MSPQCRYEPQHDYEKICQTAAKMAERVVQDLESYSKIMKKSLRKETSIPRFNRNELVVGQLLGTGGFNRVFALDQVNCFNGAGDSSQDCESEKARAALAKVCKTEKKYAIKYLRRDIMNELEDHCNGAADLMIETKILSNLPLHPNIIQLHGLASAGYNGFASGIEGGYFLIVDRLSTTLSDRLDFWRNTNADLMGRLEPICELASAMAHLHKYDIVFRDLKPDNVGFDMDGKIRLFDFGLAKELNPEEATTDDTFDMSGETGSRRYMAPEVALNLPYNLSADVYSFGILMWQTCALLEPFAGMTIQEHLDFVARGDVRPDLDETWPEKVTNILKWSWTGNLFIRPPMKEINRALKSLLKKRRLSESRADSPNNNFSIAPTKTLDTATETTSVFEALRIDRASRKHHGIQEGKPPLSLKQVKKADMNASYQVKNISRMISEGLALSQDETTRI